MVIPSYGLVKDQLLNLSSFFFFFNDTATTEIYTLSLHDALPISIFCLLSFAQNPLMFVLFSAFTFFGWAEIFSLFPALCGDFFGRKHATANYGYLYTAKGTSSMFVPIGSALAATTVVGRTFDFRADILLVVGALLVMFTVFLAPTVFHVKLNGAAQATLLSIAAVLVTYGIVGTVRPA